MSPSQTTIVLDTNFLLIPGQFHVDIFAEIERICTFPYRLAVIDLTLHELLALTQKGTGKDKKAAKLALNLIQAKKIATIKIEKLKNTDLALVALADQCHIIATQDRALRAKIKDKQAKVIILRQKQYLQMV